MKFSPLFWPVKLKKNLIYVLDESLLPFKLKYIKVDNYNKSISLIKNLKTRAIGQVLLVFYTFLLQIKKAKNKSHKELIDLLSKIANSFNNARPTLSFKYLTDLILGWACSGEDLERNILNFLEKLKNARIKQAQKVAELLNDNDSILTHCNISGLLPLVYQFSKAQNKKISFFVTETRPYQQGWRLTIWELKKVGCPLTAITDNTVAFVMQEGKVNKVIVGADNLAKNGDIANKIGTYQIAILAKYFNIPFYVVCPPPSGARTGKDIKIEIRSDKEMLEYKGRNLTTEGTRGFYPAFDITPSHLITKHIYFDL
ncbi:MAG: S-methyl-5-thioribose-1-phosphate isomerase [Candidatus Omnitrophica bacterium]|nr:S-methyl-5-thioribose-1-phosphate isomerase [Candidatus Omnitrophota bacterium]